MNKGDFRMNKNLLWTKTILSVYRYLERICGAIDKIILRSGLDSANLNQRTYYYNNVMSITQRIIDLSQRKITLINLKVLSEQCLKSIKSTDAQLLISLYVDGAKRREIAEQYGMSLRTTFRRIEAAEISFSKALRCKGYDDEKLENMLHAEAWISSVYNKYSKCENNEKIEMVTCSVAKVAAM